MRSPVCLVVMVIVLALGACAPPTGPEPTPVPAPTRPSFQATAFLDIPGWSVDSTANALQALRRSCERLLKAPVARQMTDKSVGGRVGDWVPACRALPDSGADDARAREYFKTWFQPYRVLLGKQANGLFTGYFEPGLRGSMTPSERFNIPIYKRPSDLVLVTLGDWREKLRGERIAGRIINGRLKPYYSRAEIEAGALADRARPLVWVDDAVAAFFLHIQGSGRISLPDGGVMRVGYDGHNGHVYRAIGRDLIEEGAIAKKDISLQSIRAWLGANPERKTEIMNRNPSFIFFREIAGEGPIGAQGVALTPGRSLAVDPKFLPLGAPVWLEADYGDESGRPLRRLMVAQDTGGAIRGAVRGDVFWGHGEVARALAGPMKASGRIYLLLPKTLEVDGVK
jgi:membrane-bound lytic murein transglycosylase A